MTLDVYNYFAEMTKYFKEDFLSLLGTIDVYFIADSKDTAYLYYRNCAVKVDKKECRDNRLHGLGWLRMERPCD